MSIDYKDPVRIFESTMNAVDKKIHLRYLKNSLNKDIKKLEKEEDQSEEYQMMKGLSLILLTIVYILTRSVFTAIIFAFIIYFVVLFLNSHAPLATKEEERQLKLKKDQLKTIENMLKAIDESI